jgi:hypothetical protein
MMAKVLAVPLRVGATCKFDLKSPEAGQRSSYWLAQSAARNFLSVTIAGTAESAPALRSAARAVISWAVRSRLSRTL